MEENENNNLDTSESILVSIKKLLGLSYDYKAFDKDIIMNINTVLMICNQLGVGKYNFYITGDDEKWDDFINKSDNLQAVKSYIHLKVKLMFDPPLNSSIIEAIQQTIHELEWRLNNETESEKEEVDNNE